MTWDDVRKLMQQDNLFTARKSWVGYVCHKVNCRDGIKMFLESEAKE